MKHKALGLLGLVSTLTGLLAAAPPAAADTEVCIDGLPDPQLVMFGDDAGCISLEDPVPGESGVSAKATILYARYPAYCVFSWSASVKGTGSGTYNWEIGQTFPYTHQRGAVGATGPISESSSGGPHYLTPVLSATVEAHISTTGRSANKAVTFFC